MGIVSNIRAEWTKETLDKCIKEINNLQIDDNLKRKLEKILHNHFDDLCME